MIAAAVAGLFGRCRPTAIAGFVVAVVVDAVQRQLVRSFTHVGEEVTKAVRSLPSVADFDAASTVVFVKSIFGTTTPIKHSLPRTIRRRTSLSFAGVSMFRHSDTHRFKFVAATRCGVSFSQVLALNRTYDTTIADTSPMSIAYVFDGYKAAKLTSGEINEVHRDRP